MSTAERRLAGPRLLPPLMLTAAEVADRLRVHPHTVRRWCREGRLRCFRAGHTVRIPADALTEALRTGHLTEVDS